MVVIREVGRGLMRSITAGSTRRRLIRRATLRGLVPEQMWIRLPVPDKFWVTVGEGGFWYDPAPGERIGRAVFWRGLAGYEMETVRVWLELAKRAEFVVDIGAYTGLYSLLACAANPQAQVLAFEPVPFIWERARHNIELNQWQTRCDVRQMAVSDVAGNAAFHIPHNLPFPCSASLSPQGFRGLAGEIIQVPVTTADAACGSARVDLVKIDVENFEHKVLEGMREVLRNSGPAIVLECNPDGPYDALSSVLTQLGYRFLQLRTRPTPMPTITPDLSGQFRNYLCLPPGRWASLEL